MTNEILRWWNSVRIEGVIIIWCSFKMGYHLAQPLFVDYLLFNRKIIHVLFTNWKLLKSHYIFVQLQVHQRFRRFDFRQYIRYHRSVVRSIVEAFSPVLFLANFPTSVSFAVPKHDWQDSGASCCWNTETEQSKKWIIINCLCRVVMLFWITSSVW